MSKRYTDYLDIRVLWEECSQRAFSSSAVGQLKWITYQMRGVKPAKQTLKVVSSLHLGHSFDWQHWQYGGSQDLQLRVTVVM